MENEFVWVKDKLSSKFSSKDFLLKFILAVLSFLSYKIFFNIQFVIILMVAFAIHEFGHIAALYLLKIKNKGFYFIPFIGAITLYKDTCKSYTESAIISIGGPLFGLIMALLSFICLFIFNYPIFFDITIVACMLNILNMLPATPLDGGKIIKYIGLSLSDKIAYTLMVIGLIFSFIFLYWLGMKPVAFSLLFLSCIDIYYTYIFNDLLIKYLNKEITSLELPTNLSDDLDQICIKSAMPIKSILYILFSYIVIVGLFGGMIYYLRLY